MVKDYIKYSVITKPDLSQVGGITDGQVNTTATISTANINEINYADFHTFATPTQKIQLTASQVYNFVFSSDIYEIVIQNIGSVSVYIELDGSTNPTADSYELPAGEQLFVNLKKATGQGIKIIAYSNTEIKILGMGH